VNEERDPAFYGEFAADTWAAYAASLTGAEVATLPEAHPVGIPTMYRWSDPPVVTVRGPDDSPATRALLAEYAAQVAAALGPRETLSLDIYCAHCQMTWRPTLRPPYDGQAVVCTSCATPYRLHYREPEVRP
jgi:hypothetical protein